ncbi:DNA-processing protein DprA [Persephonella sp.]|uniref:DNA-processing protein DprA n=1 Tax=Persephonella sp. TaxID=2060922 RepID=UPI00262558A3|nr:DNA-processing protein DprA [Persephonella sp.]
MSIIDYIEFSFIKGIGNRSIKRIYEEFGNLSLPLSNPEVLIEKFGKSVYLTIKNRPLELREKAEKEYELALKKGFSLVSLADEKYPQLLKEIPDPPVYIYYKGKLPDDKSISIVGSRKFSSYGKTITTKFVEKLVNDGVCIISGLAAGIDSIAHSVTLENGGNTVAVLGNGIDQIFPYENKKLYEKILENGCLISEFPIGTKASKYTFPIRNRIIAGLSYGTIVTEAGEKSGALITAKYANEYGRIVFSVPTNITNPYGKGNNLLIKEGAIPLTEIEDIYEHIPYFNKNNFVENIQLSEEEKKILNVMTEPIHIDTVVEKTGIPYGKLINLIFEMELKDLVSNVDGMYIRKI